MLPDGGRTQRRLWAGRQATACWSSQSSPGWVLGKPLGLVAASAIAVQAGFAEKAGAYSWRQLAGAGALAGIGFTMSLFIAGQAFPDENAFAAAKMAILSASVLAAGRHLDLLERENAPGGGS